MTEDQQSSRFAHLRTPRRLLSIVLLWETVCGTTTKDELNALENIPRLPAARFSMSNVDMTKRDTSGKCFVEAHQKEEYG